MLKRICRIIGIIVLVAAMNVNSNNLYAAADSKKEMICPVYETGDDSENLSMPQFEVKILEKSKKTTIPIKVTSEGIMNVILFDVVEDTLESYDDMNIDINIYTDSKQENLIASKSCGSFLGIYYEAFTFDNSGIYYLEIIVSRNNEKDIDRDINLCLMPSLIMSGDRNMKNNKWVYGVIKKNETSYYKIKINSKGYFTLDMDISEPFDSNKLIITLCDAKKKAITSKHVLDKEHNNLVFAVNTGTYYMKITSSADNKMRDFMDYRIKYCFTKLKDSSSDKSSKAMQLKINGTEEIGLQAIQKKTSDWYKVTLKKTTDLNIVMDKILLEGDFNLKLYNSKLKKIDINSDTVSEHNNKLSTYHLSSKLKKGTYYIKITKASKATSGYYLLKCISK